MADVAVNGSLCEGICSHPSHTPPLKTTGEVVCSRPKLNVYGSDIALVGDTVLSSCKHEGKIISGSPAVIHENKPVAKVGSSFSGFFTGVIVAGESKFQVP